MGEGGVAEPTDGWQWRGFLHSGRRLTSSSADGVVEQWGLDTPSEVFFPWVYSVGSEPFDPVKQQWYSDRAAAVEALDRAVSLVREHGVKPFPFRGWRKFTDGASAVYAEGNYVYGWMKTTDSLQFDVGVVNWPVVNARKIYVGGYGLFIGRSGDEKREKAAREFIKWVTQPEQQLLYTTISKQLPSTISTIQHGEFWEWMMENPIVAGFMTEASAYGTPQYVPIGYVDVLNLTMEWAYDGLKGTMPVETAVDNLLKDINVMYSNMTGPII